MMIPIYFVLGETATCAETDAYSDLCYSKNQSAPICHDGACISCLEFNINEPRWNAAEERCYSCGSLHYYAASNECVESCPASAPITVNHVCRTCYEVNWRKPKWTGSKCDYCYDSYWDGEDCVQTCPEDVPKTYAGICYSCASSLFFNPESRKCVSTCPDTLPAPNKDNVCVTCLEKDPDIPIWAYSGRNSRYMC